MEEEKRKFDLFVHGNLYYHGYLSCGSIEDGSYLASHVDYESIDRMHGIIVEGDMEVENLYVVGKKVGISGEGIWKHNSTKDGGKEEINQ